MRFVAATVPSSRSSSPVLAKAALTAGFELEKFTLGTQSVPVRLGGWFRVVGELTMRLLPVGARVC
jgi:hypothetical protein